MATKSKIEWTETTWNPVTGCTKVSQGCKFCYAETIAERFRGEKAFPNGFDLQLRLERLEEPLKWRKPRLVFVNSMSDLFHEDIPDEFIEQVWKIMEQTPRHTYQVLTKRSGRMRDMCLRRLDLLPNVWLGVSVENHKAMDRVSDLIKTPAKVRFISAEPLLDDWLPCLPNLTRVGLIKVNWIDWLIIGGESGPRARECKLDWIGFGIDSARLIGTPCFVKQLGSRNAKNMNLTDPKGGDPSEWPPEFRVRQMPEAYQP